MSYPKIKILLTIEILSCPDLEDIISYGLTWPRQVPHFSAKVHVQGTIFI